MTQANAAIGAIHGPQTRESQAMARDKNLPDGAFDAALFRAPEYFIYIYTVSDRDFIVEQPPLFPKFYVRARSLNEKYTYCGRIPHPFNQIDREGAVGDYMVRGHFADRVAQSLLNPNNLTLDQDATVPDGQTLGLGVDLNAQGVFWSKNNPPTDEEVAKAVARKERYYSKLLERARTLELSNPKELEGLINQDYHMAAEYFGVTTNWHKSYMKREECPFCGDEIKPGVAFHKSSTGVICIIDQARAKKAGVVPATVSPSKDS